MRRSYGVAAWIEKILFQLAYKDIYPCLFCTIYKQLEKEHHHTLEKPIDNGMVEKLADVFAAKLPEYIFSPAQILLSCLLELKHSPTDACGGK
jgi:chaperone BCS1